ncbi:MAG: LamG domain-containing protein [Nanoarchaeota archaeon]
MNITCRVSNCGEINVSLDPIDIIDTNFWRDVSLNANLSNKTITYTKGNTRINITLNAIVNGNVFDISSAVSSLIQSNLQGWKFAPNITIPSGVQGTIIRNSNNRELQFNISSNVPLEIFGNGFRYKDSTTRAGLQNIDRYVVYDFSDIISSFKIERNLINKTGQNIRLNESIPLRIESINNNNIMLSFNFSEVNLTDLTSIFLDPLITIDDVNSYASAKNNITTEAYPLSHITLNDSQLTFYFPFDVNETFATNTTYDYTNNNIDGIVQGTKPVWNSTRGVYGGAYNFSTGQILITDNGKLNFLAAQNYTFMAWVYPNAFTEWSAIFSSTRSSCVQGTFIYAHTSASLGWDVTAGIVAGFLPNTGETLVTVSNNNALVLNKWQHVAVLYNASAAQASRIKIYVDGVDVTGANKQSTGTLGDTNPTETYLGFSGCTNEYGRMRIDEAMYFNRTVNQAEINKIYQNQSYRYITPATQVFTNVNISQDGTLNRINVTTNTTLLLNTNISLRLLGYNQAGENIENTTPINISDGDNKITNFSISTDVYNISLEFSFISFNGNQSGNFYSPILRDNIEIESFVVTTGVKSGLVSTTIGATPFYTNESNPRNITLNQGESREIVFWINATGELGSVHNFFVYANETSSMSISNITNKFNITISSPATTNAFSINIIQAFSLPTLLNKASKFFRLNIALTIIKDIVNRFLIAFRNIAQIINLRDSVARFTTVLQSIIQRLNIVANLIRTLFGTRTITGNVVLTASEDDKGLFARGLTANNLISAVLSRTRNAVTSLTQRLNIAANLVRTLFGIRTITGNVVLTSVEDDRGIFTKGLTQNTILTTILSRTALLRANIFQLIDIDAISSKVYLTMRSSAQLLNINSILSRTGLLIRGLTVNNIVFAITDERGLFTRGQTVNNLINAVSARTLFAFRSLSDKLTIGNILTRVKTVPVNIFQSLRINDVLTKIAGFTRGIIQNAILNTFSAKRGFFGRVLNQNVVLNTVSDAFLKSEEEEFFDDSNVTINSSIYNNPILDYEHGAFDINISAYIISNGTLKNLSSLDFLNASWDFNRQSGWKFAYNLSIKDDVPGLGDEFAEGIEEIGFNVSGSNLEIYEYSNKRGFRYKNGSANDGLIVEDRYAVFDFSDILSSFKVQNNYTNKTNQTVFVNESIPLIIENSGNNILLKFNFTGYNITAGRAWTLDPKITLDDVNSYSSTIRNNITTEAYPLSHIALNDSQLTFYFPFDVNQTLNTNITYDYSNNSLDGIVQGTKPVWNSTRGVYGGAYNFSTGQILITDNGRLNFFAAQNFTFMAWIYPNAFTEWSAIYGSVSTGCALGNFIYAHTSADATWGITAGITVGILPNNGQSLVTVSTANALVLNKWQHVAVLYNASAVQANRIRIYVDGVDVTGENKANVGTLGNRNPDETYLGFSGCTNEYGRMRIDEAMYFNRTVNKADINKIYQNQSYRYITPATQLFTNVNFTAGDNRVNITTNATLLLGTNISVRLREYVGSTWWFNSTWLNISDGDNKITNFSLTNTSINNITLEFDFTPFNANQSGNFYSPVLRDNIIVDTWTQTEAATNSFIVNLSSNLAINASIIRLGNIFRNIFSNFNIPALLTRMIAVFRSASESLKINAVISQFKLVLTNLLQVLNINAVVGRTRTVFVSLAQPFMLIANLFKTLFGIRTITGNVVLTSVEDDKGLFTRGQTVNNLINAVSARTLFAFRSLSDKLTIGNILTRVKTVPVNIVQNLNIFSIVSKTGLFNRILSQQFTIITRISTVFSGVNVVNIFQNFVITPVLDTTGFFNRVLSQNVVINTIVARGQSFLTSLVQRTNLIANLVRTLLGIRTQTGNVVLTASEDDRGLFTRGSIQHLIISPIVTRTQGFLTSLTQNVILNALITRTVNFNRILSQNLAIKDSLVRTGLFFRTIAEKVVIVVRVSTGAVARNTVNLVQNFIVTPVLKTTALLTRGQTVNNLISAVVSRTRNVVASVTQPLNIAANLVRTLLGIRTITGNVVLTNVEDDRGIFTRGLTANNAIVSVIKSSFNVIRSLFGNIVLFAVSDERGLFVRTATGKTILFGIVDEQGAFIRGLTQGTILNAVFRATPNYNARLAQVINLQGIVSRAYLAIRNPIQIFNIFSIVEKRGAFTIAIFQPFNIITRGIGNLEFDTFLVNLNAVLDIDSVFDKKGFFFRIIEAILRIITGRVGPAPEPTPTPTPAPSTETSSGGGGGGGGAAVISVDFEVEPSELNLFAVMGEESQNEIKVINKAGSATISIEVNGIQDIVELSTNKLVLKQNEKASVTLKVKTDKAGIHAGRIVFRSGNFKKEVLVLVNVGSEKRLFDLSISIPKGSKIVDIGDNLRTFISLFQVGTPFEVDTNLDYIIKDFDGNLLYAESETLFVYQSKSFTKEFPTYNLKPGDYVVGIDLNYPGGFASSSEHFSIAERKIFSFTNSRTIFALGFIALILIVGIIFMIKYKRANEYIAWK